MKRMEIPAQVVLQKCMESDANVSGVCGSYSIRAVLCNYVICFPYKLLVQQVCINFLMYGLFVDLSFD